MESNKNTIMHVLGMLVMLLLCSCSDEKVIEVDGTSNVKWQKHKVAVVLPMENGLERHWKQTLGMAETNLRNAFRDQKEGVMLEYEWYDESTTDIDSLSKALATRDDVVAVIGGIYSDDVKIMAEVFSKHQKSFFTLSTTEELVRAHAEEGYLWAMTETDITQCEVLLSKALYYGAESVALLANGNDSYGKTFIDWFAFQANELGLKVKGVYRYSDNDISDVCAEAAASKADFLICAPSRIEDIKSVLNALYDNVLNNGSAPRTLFSDTAYGADVIEKIGKSCEGLEGVTFGADPESGFDISYEAFFKEKCTLGEAQVYDAAMLLTFALWYQKLNPGCDLKESLRMVVDGRDAYSGSWMAEHMRGAVNDYAEGKRPNVEGASGSLDFDAKVYTNVLSTTYYSYKVYGGKYIITDFNSSNGSNRTDATLAGWNWKKGQMQELDENQGDIKYPVLQDKWALLIAGSKHWKNYRHQADVLAVYQLLKNKGYDDEHIVLIMEDDIAYNKLNPQQGNISVGIGGENLYRDVKNDYKLSDLNPEDIRRILMGEESERLKHVIKSTRNDNILVFWSGHGEKYNLCWEDRLYGFSDNEARKVFEQMSSRECYRKMLWLVETCYAGSVMKVAQGYPGIMALTASNEDETSKADIYNESLGTWMTNRFTYTLRDEMTGNENVTLQRLYYKLFINTIGSHVMLYNHENYGNLFTNTMKEFL